MRLLILLLALPFASAQSFINNELITTNELWQEGSRHECERRGGAGCSDDLFCDSDRKCRPKRDGGEACNANFKCLSESCNRNVCDPVEVDEPSVVDPCAHIRCSGKFYCDLGVCIPVTGLLQDGQHCNSNTHCQSGNCDENVCTAPDQKSCPHDFQCNDVEYCDDNGQCRTKIANGSECDDNNQCRSGFCDQFVFEGSGVQVQPLNSNTNNPSLCQPKKDNGAGCIENFECISNLCKDFECTSSSNPTSCSKDKDCGDRQFCNQSVFENSNTNNPSLCEDKRSNGEGCNGNNECQSNNCDDFECAAADDTVLPVPCSRDNDCDDDEFCNRSVFEDSNTNNPSLCEEKRPNGEGCNGNNECQSNNCDDFECAANTGDLQPVSCSRDNDCADDEFCNKSVFEDSNTNNPSLCEEKRPNGEGCNADKECQSDNCDDFECATAGSRPLPVGGECEESSQCQSGLYCNGKSCQQQEALGSLCIEDGDCESGSCFQGRFQGRRHKTCVPVEGEVGDYCVRNIHCASNRCRGRRGERTCRAPRGQVQVSRGGGTRLGDPSWYGW